MARCQEDSAQGVALGASGAAGALRAAEDLRGTHRSTEQEEQGDVPQTAR